MGAGCSLLDGLELGEDGGVGGDGEAVEVEPLEEADPDGDLGEFGGVGVDFDAEELGGADAGEEAEGDGGLGGEGEDFFFEGEELLDGDVEKAAAGAGGARGSSGTRVGRGRVGFSIFDFRLWVGGWRWRWLESGRWGGHASLRARYGLAR